MINSSDLRYKLDNLLEREANNESINLMLKALSYSTKNQFENARLLINSLSLQDSSTDTLYCVAKLDNLISYLTYCNRKGAIPTKADKSCTLNESLTYFLNANLTMPHLATSDIEIINVISEKPLCLKSKALTDYLALDLQNYVINHCALGD